jgi:VWFA-related protein
MRYRTAIISVLVGVLAFSSFLQSPVFSQEKKDKTEQQKDQQQPTFKIGTALVTVPVIVTDRYGRFITGMNREDFLVREDGVTQKIEDFNSIESPFSVALLIDTSRSTQNKLSTIRKAALSFIKQLQPRDRVMIVTFDERVRFISDFSNDVVALERAVKSVKSSYLTSLYDAIYLTITEKMSNIQGRKAIVVLTDGVDTASKRATFESALDLVASTGIICYAIQYETRNDGGPIMKPMFIPNGSASSFISNFSGSPVRWQDPQPQQQPDPQREKEQAPPLINIPRPNTSILGSGTSSNPGSKPSTRVNSQERQPLRDRYLIAADFMRALAVQSGALYIRAENIENTSYAFLRIAVELRNQYTLTYISTNEQRDGNYRTIAVNTNRDDLVVRARQFYRAPKPEPASDSTSDQKSDNPSKP